MNETKRQHYVPRTYLEKFAIKKKKENYYIYAVDKNDQGKIIFPNVSNVCIETHIYTLEGETQQQRQALETFYSHNVDNVYNEVYQALTNENITEIDEELHYKIVMTIITMMYRTSKWIHQHNNLFDSVLENLYSLCNQTNKDYFLYEDHKYSIKGKSLEEVQKEFKAAKKEIQVLTQLDVAFKLINTRKYDGILVSKLQTENHLITSDNPVILSNIVHDGLNTFDPENMIRLPIDTSHILTIMPHSQSNGNHRIARSMLKGNMSIVNMIANNSSQNRASFKYILGSEKGLSEYISKKEEYERPISL